MFNFDMNVEFLRMAMWQIVIVAGPILGVALGIGLLIGIIQAATSINEMTLSFDQACFGSADVWACCKFYVNQPDRLFCLYL